MVPSRMLSPCYEERLNQILDVAWIYFKTSFIQSRFEITKESPFQHHFANIISTVGQLHCTTPEDQFFLDLETKCEGVRGRSKYLDITCGFRNRGLKCAIELKFKTAQQGAQDHGRIDVFSDIEALEIVSDEGFQFGRFFMITDSGVYPNVSRRGVGTVFTLHDGANLVGGEIFHCPQSVGRQDVRVQLRNSYEIRWESHQGWYFLDLPVCRPAGGSF